MLPHGEVDALPFQNIKLLLNQLDYNNKKNHDENKKKNL
jgi:hypothetical protein